MPAARNRNPIASLRRLDCVGVKSLIRLADGRSQSIISMAENGFAMHRSLLTAPLRGRGQGRRNRLPHLAEALLGFIAPVGCPEFKEDRGVRQGHVRFDNQDVEGLRCGVEFAYDVVVREGIDGLAGQVAAEQSGQQLSICSDPGGVVFGDVLQLPVVYTTGRTCCDFERTSRTWRTVSVWV